MSKLFKRLNFWLFLLLCSRVLYAADETVQIQQESQATSASVIEEKIRKESFSKDRGPDIPVVISNETDKKDSALPEDVGASFKVKKITLEGVSVFPLKNFETLLKNYEGREITVRELSELADLITQQYRGAGYLTSTAYLPEQRMTDGTARIAVIEGKIGSYSVEGNRYFRKKQLLKYIPQKSGEVFRYSKLREGLARINQNSDREVRSILKKGAEPETTDVLLRAKDHLPLHASTLFDNQGSRPTGQKRYGLTLRSTNTTGLDDSLAVGTVFGLRFGSVFTRYDLPVLPERGTAVYGSFSHVQVDPQKELKDFGVNGTSETYTAGIRHPTFRNRLMLVDLDASFDFKESRTKVLSGTFRRERLRVARLTQNTTFLDRFGSTRWEQTYAFGIASLGAAIFADPGSSRQGVEPDFFKISGNIYRRINLPFKTYAQLKAVYQAASKKLPSSEGIYLGGASTIRGYPDGDYIGDHGVYTTAEYLVPAYFIPPKWQVPFTEINLRDQIEVVGFFDNGYGMLRSPSASEVRYRHLAGAGGGFRIRLFRNFYSRFEWAAAVGDQPLSGPRCSEFHFRVQAEV